MYQPMPVMITRDYTPVEILQPEALPTNAEQAEDLAMEHGYNVKYSGQRADEAGDFWTVSVE